MRDERSQCAAPVSEAQDAINKMLERGAKAAQWERVCLCVCACACESEHKCACVCALLLPREQWTLLQRDWERGRGTGKQLEIQVTMINILQQLVASINAGATKPIPKPIPKRSKNRSQNRSKTEPHRTIRSGVCFKCLRSRLFNTNKETRGNYPHPN